MSAESIRTFEPCVLCPEKLGAEDKFVCARQIAQIAIDYHGKDSPQANAAVS